MAIWRDQVETSFQPKRSIIVGVVLAAVGMLGVVSLTAPCSMAQQISPSEAEQKSAAKSESAADAVAPSEAELKPESETASTIVGGGSTATEYDPLKVPVEKIEQLKLTVKDNSRDREIPIRVYLPSSKEPAPVILFSHGLGGSRDNSPYLGNHWAGRGYVAVFLQHAGSDEAVWKNVRMGQRMNAMRKAASGENFQLRAKDVPAVLDQLEGWNAADKHALQGRMNLKRVGMTGHSFGAVTTQAVSGQTVMGNAIATDSRILAAMAMSPSVPKNSSAENSFGKVAIPWLLMTGTLDGSPIGNTTVENRLSVYPALPKGGKYELVLDQAEHSAFGDRALPGDQSKRNPNHHRTILAISTAFWDTYLKDDQSARDWLDGDSVKKVIEPKDRWQRK